MKKTILFTAFIFSLLGLFEKGALAAGISIDAWLTPAMNRWIFRIQLRYLERSQETMIMKQQMDSYMMPIVIAYGLRPELTIIARQPFHYARMSMIGSSEHHSGRGDLFLIAKYKIFRRNTPGYILGIATTLGVEIPTGTDAFSSKSWDLQPGLYLSWRKGPLASDFNASYKWNSFIDSRRDDIDAGDELALDWAIAYQFSFREESDVSLTSVVELSYRDIKPNSHSGKDLKDSGENFLYLSPGLKLTRSSLIIEALIQIPILQDNNRELLKRKLGGLLGIRLMF